MTPILLPNERLKIGIEMQYKNTTVKDTRGDPLHSFMIGPTVAWKPTAQTRLDISPLFGCTAGAPVADVFVAFSWLFGGERAEARSARVLRVSVTSPMLPTAVPEKIQEKR